MRYFLLPAVAILGLTGCHQSCGSWVPIWIQADCGPAVTDSAAPECDLVVELSLDGAISTMVTGDAEVTLTAAVTNVSGASQTFTVYEPCPDGLVTFDGLGDGYDYYGSCLAGACPTSGEVVSYTLGDGETLDVAATLSVAGDSCNQPLDASEYELGGGLPLTDDPQPVVCETRALLTVE